MEKNDVMNTWANTWANIISLYQPALIGHYKAKLTDIGHLRKAPVCLSVSTSEYDFMIWYGIWNIALALPYL